MQSAFSSVFVDQSSLNNALDSVSTLVSCVTERLKESKLSLESVDVEIGVSASGKVGLLGSGVEAEVAASVTLSLKLN